VIGQICAFIHNYFVYGRYGGVFTIENGGIALPFLVPGQYFRICGSRLNDGVYQYPVSGLADETFEGVIWEMRVPKDVIELAAEIEDWCAANAEALNSPYQSESFGGYSYTKATGAGGSSGAVGAETYTWRNQFAHRLNQYRKLA
jgi:hypothetical protein